MRGKEACVEMDTNEGGRGDLALKQTQMRGKVGDQISSGVEMVTNKGEEDTPLAVKIGANEKGEGIPETDMNER